MLTKPSLDLADAKRLAEAVCAAAAKNGIPVSVAVVDVTTYLQVLMRMDGAPLMSAEGAIDKSRSAAEGGHPTTFFEKPLNEGRFSMVKLPHTPIEGGVPVFVDGACVGAVGVAGAPPHVDAELAEGAISVFLQSRAESQS
jgi:glc operon protein GlcG